MERIAVTDVQPMLAAGGTLPTGPGWAFEVKWDGIRILADLNEPACILTRNGRRLDDRLPTIAQAGNIDAIVDAEVIAIGADGLPTFEGLMLQLGRSGQLPVAVLAFDVLAVRGADVRSRPYRDRRALLQELGLSAPWSISAEHADGSHLWQETERVGLEGVVAKRLSSPYLSGQRSTHWVKQSHRQMTTAVLVGWHEEARTITSLVLAEETADGLRYIGRAGSGLSRSLSADLAAAVRAENPPAQRVVANLPPDLRDVTLAVTGVYVEIEHKGRTRAGMLRHPVVRGRRIDR